MTTQEFKMELKEALSKKREKLSESSLHTYSTLLCALLRKGNLPLELETFKKHKKEILKQIEDKDSAQSKKTILSALFVLTDDEDFQKQMMENIGVVNTHYKSQKMTEKQENNFLSTETVKNKMDELFLIAKQTPSILSYQNVLLWGLTSGVYVPPRRNEICYVKVTDYDVAKDNYFEKNKIIFNQYKTANKYGKQEVKLPKESQPIMKKYLVLLKGERTFMFFNPSTHRPFNSSDMSKRLSSLFGKSTGIGVDGLRMAYLSQKYKDVPKIAEMENLSNSMGHSLQTVFNDYVKK
jgi:hypothetical protein